MVTIIDSKRSSGQYYTQGNPFSCRPFREWARLADLPEQQILEPFAGSNSLIKMLAGMGLCNRYASFDISPADENVILHDSLDNFPSGYEVCITNPPWLAKNSATVRSLPFPDCDYDDLYKFALAKCLDHCPYVAALIPESFITARLFQDRLHSFISLTAKMFSDTGHPVGLALFVPEPVSDVEVWSGAEKIGRLSKLQGMKPEPDIAGATIKFNDPYGNVGLIALDNTVEASIRFCDVGELSDYKVKSTGRHITKISVDGKVRIREWNRFLDNFRDKTHDVLMTCYKGIRKDGKYRRRCDWRLARGIIHHVG